MLLNLSHPFRIRNEVFELINLQLNLWSLWTANSLKSDDLNTKIEAYSNLLAVSPFACYATLTQRVRHV